MRNRIRFTECAFLKTYLYIELYCFAFLARYKIAFTPQPLKAVCVLFYPRRPAGWAAEKNILSRLFMPEVLIHVVMVG